MHATLRLIEYKVTKSTSLFQCNQEVEEVFKFGLNLTNLFPPLSKQLQDFWTLWHDAFNLWKQSPDDYQGFDWLNVEFNLRKRMEDAFATMLMYIPVVRVQRARIRG